jgi:hypothetical protein
LYKRHIHVRDGVLSPPPAATGGIVVDLERVVKQAVRYRVVPGILDT